MRKPSLSDPKPERGDAQTPDEDWAPQIPSIWDETEDENPQHGAVRLTLGSDWNRRRFAMQTSKMGVFQTWGFYPNRIREKIG